MSKEIHVHVHVDKEQAQKPNKDKDKVEHNKTKQALKGAQIAFKHHSKEMFRGGGGFFKHFMLSGLYGLKLLGLYLQAWGREQKAKDNGKNETFKSPLLDDNKKDNLKW